MNRKKIILGIVGIIGLTILAYFGCTGKPSGKTLVTVNGSDINESDLDFIADINPRIKSQVSTPFGRKQVLNNLVEQELLYQKSVKEGLQNNPKVQAKADLYKRVIIAQALVDEAIEKAAKKYYDEHKGDYEKLEFSHIMIKFKGPEEKTTEKPKDKKGPPPPKDTTQRSEKDALTLANKVKERLDAGEDLKKLAQELSDDSATKNNGGDLGAASKNEQRFERRGWGPLLEKAFTMKVGETTGPIKTKDGYHIITVTKGVELQPFDKVEQGLIFKIQAETRNKLLGDIKKDSKIKYAAGEGPEQPKPPPEAPKVEGAGSEGAKPEDTKKP